jgi:hypothetical protein
LFLNLLVLWGAFASLSFSFFSRVFVFLVF